ncbi:MAG: glycosyltransferase (plasmid) [Candidatus Manganitrophus sp.]|nr:glycosyltransferase [Candidatus Manganitrophus sp.]MDC4228198.1 glycosyltransferase [Candidatus Manganitrophus sp.]WDT77719.1 MAG: glycosyltransferase [Candidatus Manganitrophus sp.]
MTRKKVLFYCQHVLGMGHFIRSMEIVRALNDFDVCFLNGGEAVPGFDFPSSIEVVHLPPLTSDAEFKEVRSGGPRPLKEIQAARRLKILSEFERFNPDLFIIELFPFGRRKFAFELIPLLARIRLSRHSTKVVCSLRDILVGKRDQARHEDEVCRIVNRYFDLILIHSDPTFQRLEETFSRMEDLQAATWYTGFVAQTIDRSPPDRPGEIPADDGTPAILVSIGGGRVGAGLLECVIDASPVVAETIPHRMLIFTGPYLPEEDFLRLQRKVEAKPNIVLRRYTADFLSHMKRADLSISMAGYNTCMNILTAGTKALLLPFAGNQNEEQTIRAEKLEALGVAGMIRPEELRPAFLAEKIVRALKAEPVLISLDMRGAGKSARFLSEMSRTSVRRGKRRMEKKFDPLERLKPLLEKMGEEKRGIDLFLRDDDIDNDEETLQYLFDITLARHVPLNLEIIPGALTDAGIKLLDHHKHLHPTLFELNQHGWLHLNHEKEGRKCEFGISRNFDQQWEDISGGKTLLEKIFGDKFYPVFTPPWNRCTEETFKVLDRLGFRVFSKDKGDRLVTGFGFKEISTTLDLYRWKGKPSLKSPEEIVESLTFQMRETGPIGILLHHQVMSDEAFAFLDALLGTLCQYPNIRFHTFQSLAEATDPEPEEARVR